MYKFNNPPLFANVVAHNSESWPKIAARNAQEECARAGKQYDARKVQPSEGAANFKWMELERLVPPDYVC